MGILEPNWNQQKPTWQEAQIMCGQVALTPISIESEAITTTLDRLRANHSNGGALLKAVRVGDSSVFDWFASRNRLLEDEVLVSLLCRNEMRNLLPELLIPAELESNTETEDCAIVSSGGFKFDNQFLLDGQLAQNLYAGGAYPAPAKVDGKTAKHHALAFCDAVFGQRYEDVSLYTSYEPWTPWFSGIAWDWTAILFDKRDRALWILAVTDED